MQFLLEQLLTIVHLLNKGCEVLFIPAAYECVSIGPRSWEVVHRARASGNQLYVAAISAARDEKHKYVTYGYSMVVDPNGDIKAKAGIEEEILFYEMGSIPAITVHIFRQTLNLCHLYFRFERCSHCSQGASIVCIEKSGCLQ